MAKRMVSYRLEENAADLVAIMAELQGVSHAGIIESAVMLYAAYMRSTHDNLEQARTKVTSSIQMLSTVLDDINALRGENNRIYDKVEQIIKVPENSIQDNSLIERLPSMAEAGNASRTYDDTQTSSRLSQDSSPPGDLKIPIIVEQFNGTTSRRCVYDPDNPIISFSATLITPPSGDASINSDDTESDVKENEETRAI